ncbi:hypothetical protein PRIPAC_97032, partial [Pristionchus pacificus]|uniref:Uncharacterized protein n=1 Tax=Pristionchus pacificus TaxID=54126 RepID=A0A2A6CUU7_PRIPA
VIHRDAAIVEQDYTKVMLRGDTIPLFKISDRRLRSNSEREDYGRTVLERRKCGKNEELTDRRLLVIVNAKFFSHSAEQKIKASGEAWILVAKAPLLV